MTHFTNPIIPGFYPDPSVCRVGEDYYLVTSTFEFFPGVPVFHSRDLVHWEQIGHCLTRPSQLPLQDAEPSGGIYAPTIRYHDGLFYMVTTNVTCGGNFYVTASDPAGEWSDPIYVDQGGIDPSLFFDDDGKVYFVSNGDGCMSLCEIDPATGVKLAPTVRTWTGMGGRYPEAPHLYKINGMYYIMIAEGGTEYGHMETIARSASPYGPWEPSPRNPILTNRNTQMDMPIQATGHADLVQTQNGDWYAVFLAFRMTQGYFHHLGRETYLAPVVWEGGFPYIGTCPLEGDVNLPEAPVPQIPATTDFSAQSLEWVTLREPNGDRVQFTENGLLLHGMPENLNAYNPTILLRRQQHFDMRCETTVDFEPRLHEEAGITTFYNLRTHYELYLTRTAQGRRVQVRRIVGDMEMLAADIPAPAGEVALQVTADKLTYTFWCNGQPLCTGLTQFLSTEATPNSFTGVMLGLYATGNGCRCAAPARFAYFTYEGQN